MRDRDSSLLGHWGIDAAAFAAFVAILFLLLSSTCEVRLHIESVSSGSPKTGAAPMSTRPDELPTIKEVSGTLAPNHEVVIPVEPKTESARSIRCLHVGPAGRKCYRWRGHGGKHCETFYWPKD